MKLELRNVRLPLAPFTLEVEVVMAARVTGILGASGAGKTSLLEIIAGLRRPVAGQVVLNGTVLSDAGQNLFLPPEKRGIGYVPQEGALFPHLTVRENLLYGHGRHGPAASDRPTYLRVVEVLEIFGLASRAVATLSGGERQRVALGRALLAAPRLLLLDEPLAGLDAPLRERLLPYLARVRDEFGLPMLHVTHSPDEVMALCEDVIVLTRGHVVQRGKPAELLVPSAKPHHVLRESGAIEPE